MELKPEPPKTPTVEEKQLPSQGLLTEGGASKDKDDKAWTDKAVIVSYTDINPHGGGINLNPHNGGKAAPLPGASDRERAS